MKRLGIFFFIAMLFTIAACSLAFAETVGSPIDVNTPPGPGVISENLGDYITLNIGAEGEVIWDRDLDVESGITNIDMDGALGMLRISCTLCDRIQPYIKFGAGDFEVSWEDSSGSFKAKSEQDLAWGMGVKALLWNFESHDIKLTSKLSYREFDSSVDKSSATAKITSSIFEITETQAALALSKQYEIPNYEEVVLVPYGGIKYSELAGRIRYVSDGLSHAPGILGYDNNFGLFFGVDAMFGNYVGTNLEFSFLNEDSISLGCTVLF